MRKNYFLSAALIALTGFGLVGCSDNPDRITNVNEIVKEQVDLGGYVYNDANNNGAVDSGEGLSGVIVQVHDAVQDKVVTATTDTNGRYDFTQSFTEGSYNITLTDSSSTPNGAVVGSVEYYMPEIQVNLTQPGDMADGTPEQGAIAIDFPMISNPVMMSTNLGNVSKADNVVNLASLTELTFTFNKPVTVINDPRLVDLTAVPNKAIALTAGTSASIKAATVQGSSYTTVAYKLPTLEANHQFNLTWLAGDIKATDNSQGAYTAAGTNEAISNAAAGTYAVAIAGVLANAANNMNAIGAAAGYGTTAGNQLNTGSVYDIVTTANTPVIKSVVVAGFTAPNNAGIAANTYSPVAGKYAIFAPEAGFVAVGGRTSRDGLITTTFNVQLSNVKSDLDYCPVVSYDGGTTWHFAQTNWTAGSTAQNGSLTIATSDLSNLTNLPRPYFLVKGFYNTKTTAGEDYTRLKMAVRRANADLTVGTAGTNGLVVGATGDADDAVAGYSANGIDKNTDRAADTWVNIFDGDLTDYRNRGFNRMSTAATAALVNVTNGLPAPTNVTYMGSSHPFPLYFTNAVVTLPRSTWFGIVEDHEILTDLVEPDGDIRNTVIPATNAAAAANTIGLRDGYMPISGIMEAASASININDNPNPSLGTLATVVYVYFNEPMDKTTIESTTNWRSVTTVAAAAPAVSKVEYAEAINTANGLEVFRAKVTLAAALVTGQRLEVAAGAMVDKNGNYPMITDNTKPTSYLTVFHN